MGAFFRNFFVILVVAAVVLFALDRFAIWRFPLFPWTTFAVTGFSPGSGLPGTIVTIEGSGFGPDPYANVVTIGGSPTRVLSGGASQLRVVALRNLTTGKIVVQNATDTATSAEDFKRAGTTTRATPLADSDAELAEGQGYDKSRRYDMTARGLNQKILVILAKPSDINPETLAPAGSTARDSIVARLGSANTYFQEASYGATSAAFSTTTAWVTLSQPRDFYAWQQEDIDRAQAALDALALDPSATAEAVEAAQAARETAANAQGLLQEGDFFFAESLLGAKAAVADFDTYTDYFIVMAGPFMRGQNIGTATEFHAESSNPLLAVGPFDITLNGPKGITYVAQEADWGRMVHELSHFFSIGDIYQEGFANGTVLEGSAAPFAMMGNHDEHPLYIGYNIDKMLGYYDGSNIRAIEWGSAPTFDETIEIEAHARTQDPAGDLRRHVLKIRVGEGLFYYVEVRQKPEPTLGAAATYVFDTSIPLDASAPAWKGGVIIYKAVEANNQSNNNERPVSLLPPFRMLQAGEFFEDPARTLRIDVVARLADRPATYSVRVRWGVLPSTNPDGQFDLRISPWTPPPWESPDIWTNSPKNDDTSTAPVTVKYHNHEPGDETAPTGNGDRPWVGHDNTIFARVSNLGVAPTPENVRVSFYVNSPPGVGDNGTWAPFDTIDIGVLAPGETRVISASRKWRPAAGEHTCVKVEMHRMNGEVTFDNNVAQENFSDFDAASSSPYRAVEFDVVARNPYEAAAIMDMQAHGLPKDWFVAFDKGSLFLKPREEKPVHVAIWTDRPVAISAAEEAALGKGHDQRPLPPRKALISIEGRMEQFGARHQTFAVGGVTAFVRGVADVKINLRQSDAKAAVGRPFNLTGAVTPNTGPTPLTIEIVEPSGAVATEQAMTDASGSFNITTAFRPPSAGVYKATVHTLPGGYAAEASSRRATFEVL